MSAKLNSVLVINSLEREMFSQFSVCISPFVNRAHLSICDFYHTGNDLCRTCMFIVLSYCLCVVMFAKPFPVLHFAPSLVHISREMNSCLNNVWPDCCMFVLLIPLVCPFSSCRVYPSPRQTLIPTQFRTFMFVCVARRCLSAHTCSHTNVCMIVWGWHPQSTIQHLFLIPPSFRHHLPSVRLDTRALCDMLGFDRDDITDNMSLYLSYSVPSHMIESSYCIILALCSNWWNTTSNYKLFIWVL